MPAASVPNVQTAIIAGDDGDFLISSNIPVATLLSTQILIKTTHVALNPVDTKLVGDFVTPGVTFGFDCAGTIVAVGDAVTRDLRPGDRVCGSADAMNPRRPQGGAFAEYVVLPGELALKVPEGMGLEEAAALGTAVASATMALFWSLGIPGQYLAEPVQKGDEDVFEVLIYGGSSATGTMLIQIVKLCGLIPITTCSPKNFSLVKSYGAAAAFDYNSPSCAAEIRNYTKNDLAYAVDCITQAESMRICYGAIGRAGGRYTALDPFPQAFATRRVVLPDWILATRIIGEGCTWPEPYRSEREEAYLEWGKGMMEAVQGKLEAGAIRSHPVSLEDGGWEGVLHGIGRLRRKEISGKKLVYKVD